MINGNRIKQAREVCGWTQGDLAYRIGIKQPTLAQLEIGTDKASDRVIGAISARTDFLPSFFEKADSVEFPLGSLLFRAHSSITSRQRTEAFRHAQLLFEIWGHLSPNINEIPVRVPTVPSEPIMAARLARAELGVSPDTPISFIVNLVEKSGIVVLAIPGPLDRHDAFSLWAGNESRKPVIAITSGATGDRVTWSVAHELGHLIMHHPIRAFTGDLEEQADEFAAEFLLPESGIREELQPPFSLETFAVLKARWRVSMQALIRRARALEIISERHYRYLFEQIGVRGWRKAEPCPIPAEKPRGLREMAELIYGKPLNYARMSKETGIGVGRLRNILNAHAQRGGETHGLPCKTNRRATVITLRAPKRTCGDGSPMVANRG